MTIANSKILLLGLGNTLLGDDGVGVHIVNRLQSRLLEHEEIECVDGGTLGLSLLTQMDLDRPFIAVDAAQIGLPAGAVRVFEGEQMDMQLSGRKSTSHEVALADLMDAALLTGIRPDKRALVAIQPRETGWGDAPTPAVAAAIETAESEILALIDRWQG